MATKKKISPIEILKPIKPNEYTPVFKTVEIVIPAKIDLNWIGVRRKIQQFNFFKLIKAEQEKTFKEKYGFDLWEIYCKWFNSKFNRIKEDTITEKFNHE